MKPVVRLLALAIGVYVGFRFPDFDQRADFLTHRSIVTHGLLVPLLLYFMLGSRRSPAPARLFVAGAALAVAVHLSFDLFPRAWWRHALIHLPAYGWTSPFLSWSWIAVSIVVCFFIAIKSARSWLESALVFVLIFAVFSYSLPTEHALWRPLAAMIVGGTISVVLVARGKNQEEFQ